MGLLTQVEPQALLDAIRKQQGPGGCEVHDLAWAELVLAEMQMSPDRFVVVDGRGLQHSSYTEAQREAERLSAAYPGAPFYVAELRTVARKQREEAPPK